MKRHIQVEKNDNSWQLPFARVSASCFLIFPILQFNQIPILECTWGVVVSVKDFFFPLWILQTYGDIISGSVRMIFALDSLLCLFLFSSELTPLAFLSQVHCFSIMVFWYLDFIILCIKTKVFFLLDIADVQINQNRFLITGAH